MAYQANFKRYELKYIITLEQKERILEIMKPYMALDDFGRTTIRNIYFDTDTYRLIRRSIEKPTYKEKLRIRSYSKATSDSPVFVELKKKYKHIVYKRRLSMPEEQAMQWICERKDFGFQSQISAEINYFCKYYETLQPTVFLSYEREAYYSFCGDDFRITFDDNILCRQDDLSLQSDIGGTSIFPNHLVLMEVKCSGGIPLWLTHMLSEERIYKTSFSKYGTAYQTIILPQLKGELLYA